MSGCVDRWVGGWITVNGWVLPCSFVVALFSVAMTSCSAAAASAAASAAAAAAATDIVADARATAASVVVAAVAAFFLLAQCFTMMGLT